MKLLATIETGMANVFKDLPSLSRHNKEMLVRVLPWTALIFGILQVLSLLSLWDAVSLVRRLSLFEYTVHEATQFTVTMAYINMAVLLVTAVMLLLAYAPLKAQARRGWELLFYVGLINVVSGVVAFFTYGQGIGSTIFSFVVSGIMFYLLFQVLDRYKSDGLKEPDISDGPSPTETTEKAEDEKQQENNTKK